MRPEDDLNSRSDVILVTTINTVHHFSSFFSDRSLNDM
jgi:hypothetical protein